MKTYTEYSALKFISRNCNAIRTKWGHIIVKCGTAGNGTLGAIDYIRNYTKTIINIAPIDTFEDIKKNVVLIPLIGGYNEI